MLKNRWVLVAAALLIVLALFWYLRRERGETVAIDLIEAFDTAEKRSSMPMHEAFGVASLTINGETKRTILAHPTSRIVWRFAVPQDATLRTSLGINPEAWDKSPDGVLFRVGVSDGTRYEELLNQHVNPSAAAGDRRWIPVSVDLSAYGGLDVELVFNTNSSLPGKGDNPIYDWAHWGTPAIYARR